MTINSIPSSYQPLIANIGKTPMKRISVRIHRRWRSIFLKLEGFNPAGSSKDRAAASLIRSLERGGSIHKSSIVLESTSGNLGASLAFVCRELGYRFLAVIDPKTTPENRRKIQDFGGELELVVDRDEHGGYLLSRLRRIRELCETSSRFVWTDQYSNPANPLSHFLTTAPEIQHQMVNKVDAIFVAVSTGGTLAGVGQYFRKVSPTTRIIAVDVRGSVVFGGTPGPRLLTGIGSSQGSQFIKPEIYDNFMLVEDRNAISYCRALNKNTGLRVGGSSGAALFACSRYLAQFPEVENPVCICPDDGANYQSTIFDDVWLLNCGFDPGECLTGIDGIAECTQ